MPPPSWIQELCVDIDDLFYPRSELHFVLPLIVCLTRCLAQKNKNFNLLIVGYFVHIVT